MKKLPEENNGLRDEFDNTDKEFVLEYEKESRELWGRPRHKLSPADFFITVNRTGYCSLRWKHNNRRISSYSPSLRTPKFDEKYNVIGWEDLDPLPRAISDAKAIIKALNANRFDKECYEQYYSLYSFFESQATFNARGYTIHSVETKEVNDKAKKTGIIGFIKEILKGE